MPASLSKLSLPSNVSAKTVLAELPKYLALAGVVHTVGQVLFSWMKARRMHKMIADVPTADHSPGGIFGFLQEYVKNAGRMYDWLDEVSKGKSSCKMIGLAYEPAHVWFLVRDPTNVKHILKDNFEIYSKPRPEQNFFYYLLPYWIGNGIFTAVHGEGAPDHGKLWYTQRKTAAGIFTKSNFQNYMGDIFVSKANRMCDLLEAKNGEFVDLQAMFFNFTMDSIMQILVGETVDTLGGESNEYAQAFDTAHWNMWEYMNENMAVLSNLVFLPFPFGGQGGLAQSLHMLLSSKCRTFMRACNVLSRESNRLVDKCRNDPNLGKRKDLLAMFVQSEEKHQFSHRCLRDTVLNFVMAGRDTTACTLSWVFFVLCTHPEIQQKLIQEVEEKLGDETPTLKSLAASNMPYLNGVLYEVLRYYPILPIDLKCCHKDDTLPDGSKVPKGAMIFYMPYAMGRDPAIYADPHTIRPERWIPFKAPPPHEFTTFQAGPRICLGMDMAIFEMKVVMVTLLRRFSFDLKEGEAEKITYAQAITMSICNSPTQDSANLWIRPKKRQPVDPAEEAQPVDRAEEAQGSFGTWTFW